MLSRAPVFSRGAVNGRAQVPSLVAKFVQRLLQRLPGLMQLVRRHAGKRTILRLRLQHQVFDRHRCDSFAWAREAFPVSRSVKASMVTDRSGLSTGTCNGAIT